jgi:hypothetical protein
MKRFPLSILFIAFVISSCTSKNEKKAAINVEKTVLKAFTDTAQLDTFKIALKGTESKNMSLLFTITSYKGVQVYKKEIKAEELLKSYLASAELKKEEEKIKFLNDEVNFFLDEEHFLMPAITEQEKPDNNTPDKTFYEELKASKLNGFDYRLGKDIKIYIAWSAKEQKVKIYYKCC